MLGPKEKLLLKLRGRQDRVRNKLIRIVRLKRKNRKQDALVLTTTKDRSTHHGDNGDRGNGLLRVHNWVVNSGKCKGVLRRGDVPYKHPSVGFTGVSRKSTFPGVTEHVGHSPKIVYGCGLYRTMSFSYPFPSGCSNFSTFSY